MRYRVFLGASGGFLMWLLLGAVASSATSSGSADYLGSDYFSIGSFYAHVARHLGLSYDWELVFLPLLVALGAGCGYCWHMLATESSQRSIND